MSDYVGSWSSISNSGTFDYEMNCRQNSDFEISCYWKENGRQKQHRYSVYCDRISMLGSSMIRGDYHGNRTITWITGSQWIRQGK